MSTIFTVRNSKNRMTQASQCFLMNILVWLGICFKLRTKKGYLATQVRHRGVSMSTRCFVRWLRFSTAAIAICLFGIPVAQAATIVWGSETDISGDPDVSTNGTLVGAFNLGGSSTTVNGVAFEAFVIGPPQVGSQTEDSFYTLSIVPERAEHTLTNFDTSSTLSPFTTLSSGYQALLGTSAGSNFADRVTTLTLSGLMIGTTYQFQAWVNDSHVSGCCSFGIFLDNSVNLDPNTERDAGGDVVEGGLGQYVIGTFVADATSQALDFERGEIGGGLNGFQLREVSPQAVPEPATIALIGTALLGLAVRRRRPG